MMKPIGNMPWQGLAVVVAYSVLFVQAVSASESWPFNSPFGVAVNSQDVVYVAEIKAKRISKFTPDGKPRVGLLPWLADEPENFAVFGLLAPNFHMLARRDFVRPYFMWPITPDTSRAVIYHLFEKDEVAKPGFREKADIYYDWYKNVFAEDLDVVQSLQSITGSDWFMAERMSKMETAIHHFITAHIERLMVS